MTFPDHQGWWLIPGAAVIAVPRGKGEVLWVNDSSGLKNGFRIVYQIEDMFNKKNSKVTSDLNNVIIHFQFCRVKFYYWIYVKILENVISKASGRENICISPSDS